MRLSNKQLAVGSAAAALVVFFLFMRGNDPVGAEKAADEIVDRGIDAIERGDVGDVMELIAPDFVGETPQSSRVDRGQLKQYLAVMLLRRDGVGVTVVSQDVEIHSETSVTVWLNVVVTRGGARGALSGNAGEREVELSLSLRDDQWLVTASRIVD